MDGICRREDKRCIERTGLLSLVSKLEVESSRELRGRVELMISKRKLK